MNSSLAYELTEDSFNQYEALLSAQGFKVTPEARVTNEDVQRGTIRSLAISGAVDFQGEHLRYDVRKDSAGYHLTVYDALGAPAELAAALKRAFPQAESPPAAPEEVVIPRWTLGSTLMFGGCLTVLLFLAAVCFFVIAGIRSFMR
jgi:hypothetical protein